MSEVKLDASGLTTPSIVLGNNILTSEEDKLIWNGEEFKSSGGGGHNVGEQWISMDGTIPFGGLAFLGQTASKETYIELYNWVETNGRFKTEAEWQTLYTANNGNVSFYAKIDDNTFRLPSFKGYLKANESAGEYTKEGLPNITGSVNITDNVMVNTSTSKVFHPYSGAFHQTTTSSGPRAIAQATSVETWADGRNIEFSAQKSNSIYGNSTHVTPETNTILIGVYAFNTIINDSDIEVDTIRQRVDELETLSKHAVGEQWISMDGTVPRGGVPFNGQILNIADYQVLYNWAKDNSRIKSESEWQTLKTNNNSNVVYYSQYSNTQFRMPLFRGYLKADSSSGYIKQGLPNITGVIDEAYGGYGGWGGTGAFSVSNGSTYGTRGGGGGDPVNRDISFNASRSSSIYGNSSNVTPETSKILVGVYAFNTVVNAAILDATSEITSHIKFSIANPHYDIGYTYGSSYGPILSLRSVNYTSNPGGFELSAINASNQKRLMGKTDGTLTWDGKHVIRLVESGKSGTIWYRKYSDGFIEQGGTYKISGQGAWDLPTITFLKPFSNTNYSISVSGISYNGAYHAIGSLQSKTTTSFKHYFYDNVNINPSWYACGY